MVGILGVVELWLIVAKDVIVTVAEGLASAELCVNVTNDVMVTILLCSSHFLKFLIIQLQR